MTKQQEKDWSKLPELDTEDYDMLPEEKEQFQGKRIFSDRPTSISGEQKEENAGKDKTIEYVTIALVTVGFLLLIIL